MYNQSKADWDTWANDESRPTFKERVATRWFFSTGALGSVLAGLSFQRCVRALLCLSIPCAWACTCWNPNCMSNLSARVQNEHRYLSKFYLFWIHSLFLIHQIPPAQAQSQNCVFGLLLGRILSQLGARGHWLAGQVKRLLSPCHFLPSLASRLFLSQNSRKLTLVLENSFPHVCSEMFACQQKKIWNEMKHYWVFIFDFPLIPEWISCRASDALFGFCPWHIFSRPASQPPQTRVKFCWHSLRGFGWHSCASSREHQPSPEPLIKLS